MEEGTCATSGEVKEKPSNKVDVMVNRDERKVVINCDSQGSKEEYEETALGGEFIKIEKESIYVSEVEETPRATNIDSRNSVTTFTFSEFLKRMKDFEIQDKTAVKELQKAESEKALLEVGLANEKLEKIGRQCEEHELDRKRMSLQLQSLQVTLGARDVKLKELVRVKEAFNEVSTEMESSRKRIQELEVHLVSSSGEAHKFEELFRERSLHAEFESKRASEFEKMLEVAKLSANEMEDQISNLQEELKGLYCKIADLEQQCVYRDNISQVSGQVLAHHRASEKQTRADLHTLEVLLSATKEDLQVKLVNLEEIELKLQKEIKARETIEAKLNMSDQNFNRTSSLLSQVSSQKEELELKLKSLGEELKDFAGKRIEHEGQASTSRQRILTLENLVHKFHNQAEHAGKKVGELEQLLSISEAKNRDFEAESKQHDIRVSQLSAELEAFQMKSERFETVLQQQETIVAENRKLELEEALLKLQKLEGFVEETLRTATQFETENKGLARANINLSQVLSVYEAKMDRLQMALNAIVAEKEEISLLLQKTIEELMQKLASVGEGLQSQNIEQGKKLALVNAELDRLKLELNQTVEMEKKITELEELQLANAKPLEQASINNQSLRSCTKSKERIEEVSLTTEMTSANPAVIVAAKPFRLMPFDFILVVALLSMIVGLVIGKRY